MTPNEAEKKLAISRARLRAIKNLQRQPDNSPEDNTLLMNLQRSQQAAVTLREKAVQNEGQDSSGADTRVLAPGLVEKEEKSTLTKSKKSKLPRKALVTFGLLYIVVMIFSWLPNIVGNFIFFYHHPYTSFFKICLMLSPGLYALWWSENPVISNAERLKRFASLLALLALVGGVIWLAMYYSANPNTKESNQNASVTQAVAMDGRIRCQARENVIIGTKFGPCEGFVAPEKIAVGQKFRANGKDRIITAIQATQADEEIPDYGIGAIKKGEWWCVAGESQEDIDLESDQPALFIVIPKCRPGVSETR